jgi:hypothetical protein
MAAAHASTSLLAAPDGALRIVLHSRFSYHVGERADYDRVESHESQYVNVFGSARLAGWKSSPE